MSQPDIRDEDIALVAEALRSNRISLGPFIDRFEQAFADYIGVDHAVAVSSGTAGLHLCVCAAGIGPGDEVITTPFSFVASANCILYERATPVFVDIDQTSLNIDADLVRAAVTARTRAILPVHIFGQPCDFDGLLPIANEHGIPLIEDACEAIGAEFRGRKVGTFGKAAVFAFYPNKQITTGEGGVIVTNDPNWAATFRILRNQGRAEMGSWLHHERLGFNYRLDEMSAALGLSQLARLEELLQRRDGVASMYAERLKDIPDVTLLSPVETTTRLSWFVLVVRLSERISRDRVMGQLQERGIPSRSYFSPIHLQPYFAKSFGFREGDFPIAERVAKSTLALPFHANMPRADVDYVATSLKMAIEAAAL